MKILISLGFLSCGLVLCPDFSMAQPAENSIVTITNVVDLLKIAPPVEGEAFCCDSIVRVVNGLRRLGKEGALNAMRLYLAEPNNNADPERSDKVLIICRLLFVNPEGWKHPGLGHPFPEFNQDAIDKNPLFPLILSDGIPFLLVNSYGGSGYTDDTGDKCLQICEGFTLITKEIPEMGYTHAAYVLIESDDFKASYADTNVLKYVNPMILAQAQCSNPMTRMRQPVKSSIDVKMWSVPRTNN
jgi:hypothetical protein